MQHTRRSVLRRASGFAAAAAAGLGLGDRSPLAAGPADAALDDLSRALAADNSGVVLRPGSAGYARIGYYNARFDCVKPKAFVRPASSEGVLRIVDWARRAGRRLAVRGAGHSFEGKSCSGDIVVDMSGAKGIRLAADGRLTVEAGATLGDVYTVLAARERVLPAGTCPSVGIVGHVLGGGIGDFLPMFGYAAQSLEEATLVTFDGSIVTVRDEGIALRGGQPVPGPALDARELMQVLRGGGQGSLGIVTGMRLRTWDVGSSQIASFQVESADDLTADRTIAIVAAWMEWRERQPQAMRALVSSKLNLVRSGNSYSADIAGLMVVPRASAVKVADIKATVGLLQRAARLGRVRYSAPLDAAGAIKTFLDDDDTTSNPRRRLLYGSSSVLPKALPQPAIEHLVRRMPTDVYVSLYTSGGASRSGPATSLHASEFLIEWVSWHTSPDPAAYQRLRAVNAEMLAKAGFADIGFPNYPDHGARDYFPDQALIDRVKRQCDVTGRSLSALVNGRAAEPADAACGEDDAGGGGRR